MTDYGTIYGLNTSDPLNSRVYLSWIPTTGTSSASVIPSVTTNRSVHYVEDNDTLSVFSFVAGSTVTPDLYEYKVSFGNGTGTSSILLENTINFTAPTSSPFYIGLKRVSSSSYYLYYLDITTGASFTMDFRRLEIGTGTDTSLASETLSFSVADASTTVIGRSMYITFSRLDGTNRKVYLYHLDMDTESLHSISVVDLGSSVVVNGLVRFHGVMELNGEVKLWIDYGVIVEYLGFDRFTHKIYYGGNTSDVLEIYPYNAALVTPTVDRQKYIYNGRDTKVARTWIYNGTTYYFTIDSVAGGFVSASNNTPDASPLRFTSDGSFPKIKFTGGSYYWLDANGQSTGAISLTGATIRTIFPTLDSINGNMYVSALVGGVTNKLLSVNPYTGAILDEYIIGSFPHDTLGTIASASNHGNFFFQVGSIYTCITYLDNAPAMPNGIGESQIIEMN